MKQFLNLFLLLSFSLTAFALEINEKLVNGGVKIIDFESRSQPTVSFYGKKVLTHKVNDTSYRAFIGIPIGASVGTHTFNTIIKGNLQTHTFTIKDGAYKKQYITLKGNKKKYVDIADKDLKRIKKESALIARAKRSWIPELYVDNITTPTTGIITGVFGSQRVFNNKPRRPHSGLDIANDTGTPVQAIANGKVILTGDFFFNGKTVILDHGMGLLSLYVHLDEIFVTQGDMITMSKTIGSMGATGRATGSHLHISIYLNEVAIDPLLLLNYSL